MAEKRSWANCSAEGTQTKALVNSFAVRPERGLAAKRRYTLVRNSMAVGVSSTPERAAGKGIGAV
jgi:hypothetical protein